jgi:hypothetical protein
MNLYLYIPLLSAHSPSCFKGLIAGELQHYWIQNSPSDFQDILTKFITCLTERGQSLDKLIPIFKQAAARLDIKPLSTNNGKDSQNTLYIHWRYRPNGLQNRDIQQIFNNTLKD